MANTLKFGNGNWATKDGSTLAYNDESGFNPLPFDFTRASSATVVNKNGLIETVASGIPRIDFLGNTQGALLLEPSRTNLITESEAFASTYWLKNGASIQGDASTAGAELVKNGDFATDSDWVKDGETTISAGKCRILSTAGAYSAVQQLNVLTIGKTYKLDIDIVSYNAGLIRVSDGTTILLENISSVNSYSVTFIATNTKVWIYRNGITDISIDNVSVKEVQGFASPSADSPLGAFKLVEDTSNGGHNIQRVENVSNATIYTSSVFVKYGGREWIRFTDAQSSNRIHFNTLTGAFGAITGTVIDYNSIALSNGWYKLSITTTSVATAYALRVSLAEADNDVSYTGDGTSGVYIYGAQLEAGSYSTSLINTSGSVVTREADVCDNGANSEVINSTEGVFFLDFKKEHNGLEIWSINDGTTANRVYMGISGTNFISQVRNAGGAASMQINTPINNNTRYKCALAYKENDFVLYINGVQIGTDNSGLAPINMSKLSSNAGLLLDAPFFSPTNEIKLYNTRLSNSELATLTTI